MTKAALLTPLQDLSAAFTGLVAKIAPSIVSVRSHRSRSSGFVWRPGLIVTADEALSEEGELAVTLPGGDTVAAQLAGRDSTTDVALLRIDRAGLEPVLLRGVTRHHGRARNGSGRRGWCADRRGRRRVPRRRSVAIPAWR